MALRIAINGFGRIGRNVVRAQLENSRPDIEIVMINDLADIATSAHLLEYDSVHGRIGKTISTKDHSLFIDSQEIHYHSQPVPSELDYKVYGVDVVFECTGRFTSADTASAHLRAGASKVVISAPGTKADKTIVYGVNHETLTADDKIISNASCTTNCLAPLVSVLDQLCGIKQGFMTTIHAYTGDQQLLDSEHRDLYRARAAAINMIPTTTGAARAISLVLPHLAGRLDGVAVRVPTPNVSAVDLVFESERPSSAEDINHAMIAAANGRLKDVLAVTDRPVVSSDLNHHPASSILHLDQTKVMDTGMSRIFSWYDNEWGFSNRMLDLAQHMSAMK